MSVIEVPDVDLTCPHCGSKLKPFRMPTGAGWDQQVQWACFDNDCPYYREGWGWMREQYGAKTSYRYRVEDLDNPKGTPLVVNSENALFDLIVEDES